MRFYERRKRDRRRDAEPQSLAARNPDPEAGNAKLFPLLGDCRGLGRRRGQHISPLILAEEECVLGALRRDRRADAPGHRHLGERDGEAAVGKVMDGADTGVPDERGDERAVQALGGKIDRRRRALVAARDRQ